MAVASAPRTGRLALVAAVGPPYDRTEPGLAPVIEDARMKPSKRSPGNADPPASALIDRRIAELGGWRGETLARLRALIHAAVPDVVEEWKWMGTPVWSHGGIVCTGESYRDKIKLTFMKGASLDDPRGLFNASLDGNVRRAIDLHEGDAVDADAFKALVRAAAALNASAGRARNVSGTMRRGPDRARPR
jgi:hypothetical protein